MPIVTPPATTPDTHTLPDRGQRLAYLEGLRGLAALQVVLLHYLSAFLPGLAFNQPHKFHTEWEGIFTQSALRFFYDGSGAVCLFFLLSGAVLSLAFEKTSQTLVANVGRRLVRLGLPPIAALIFSYFALTMIPDSHHAAARISGSLDFLSANMSGPTHILFLLKETILNSMLIGYAEFTPFRISWRWVDSIKHSFDPPIWTLHLEFYGSVLVLLLARARSTSRILHAIMVLGAAVTLLAHPLILFVIGHLCAPLLRSPNWQRMARRPINHVAGGCMLAFGIVLAVSDELSVFSDMQQHFDHYAIWRRLVAYGYTAQHMVGEFFIFFGIITSINMQKILGTRSLRRLGALSFSIYLVHFPILFTVVSLAFENLSSELPYMFRFFLVALLGLISTWAIAVLFERWVDKPATELSRRIGRRPEIRN